MGISEIVAACMVALEGSNGNSKTCWIIVCRKAENSIPYKLFKQKVLIRNNYWKYFEQID